MLPAPRVPYADCVNSAFWPNQDAAKNLTALSAKPHDVTPTIVLRPALEPETVVDAGLTPKLVTQGLCNMVQTSE